MRRVLAAGLVLALVVLVAVLVTVLVTGGGSDDDLPPVTTLPEVTLAGLDDDTEVDLSTRKGPMVVNLFASWCGPCREELPIYQQFEEEHGDRVAVLGIDYQDPQTEAALALVAKSGVTFEVLVDPEGTLSAAEPFPVLRGLPFLVLVDDEGAVVFVEPVLIESLGQLEDLVALHLGVQL